MDRSIAEQILKACALAFEPLNSILLERSDELTDADYRKLRHNVADMLAYMFDFLIGPVISELPELNPYGQAPHRQLSHQPSPNIPELSEQAVPKIPPATARKIFAACQEAGDSLDPIFDHPLLAEDSPDRERIRHQVKATLAAIYINLIEPAADQHPDLNPYKQ